MPGIYELLIIAGIMLFLFGGKKVPDLMSGLGKGIKEFKKGVTWTKEDDLDVETRKLEDKADES